MRLISRPPFGLGAWTRLAALSALAVLLIAGAVAADEEFDPTATFFEPLQVPLVSIDVTVTDNDGRPLGGLTAADFEVVEDGRPVEITHFYASPGFVARSDEPAAEPQAAGDQGLFLAVYIDDSNLNPARRRAALEHVRGFLERPLPDEVQAMLVRYDGGLHIAGDFSRDADALLPALERFKDHAPVNFTREAEMLVAQMRQVANATAVHNMGQDGLFGGGNSDEMAGLMAEDFLPQIHSMVRAMYIRNRASLNALAEFVRLLSGVPGRKAVLWVGSGIETRVGESMFQAWQGLFPDKARELAFNAALEAKAYDFTRELRDLVRFANSHRVSFYTLSGLSTAVNLAVSAETRNIDTGASPGFMNLMSEEEALAMMSGFTGGRTLADNEGLDRQLHQVSDELSHYYSIGYPPPEPGDGEYHRIKVRVLRDGVTVRHREGYLDSGDPDRMANRTFAAAMLGVADNPMGIAVECRPQEPRDDGSYLVQVLVRIPIGELVLLPDGQRHEGQVSVFTAVRDGAGNLSKVHGRQYPVAIANEQLLAAVQQEAGFVVALVMRQGPQRIAISVRDDKSLVESTAYLDVVVGTDAREQSG